MRVFAPNLLTSTEVPDGYLFDLVMMAARRGYGVKFLTWGAVVLTHLQPKEAAVVYRRAS